MMVNVVLMHHDLSCQGEDALVQDVIASTAACHSDSIYRAVGRSALKIEDGHC
jgi:hypothetical protein